MDTARLQGLRRVLGFKALGSGLGEFELRAL